MIVAIFGSREGVDRRRVEQWVKRIAEKHPGAVVMSGGARGTDLFAEAAAEHYGLRTVSLRPESFVRWQEREQPLAPARWADEDNPTPAEIRDRDRFRAAQAEFQAQVDFALTKWVVVVYELAPDVAWTHTYALKTQYDSFRDAALARNTLLAQLSDRGVAFWNGKSSGTAFTISEFGRLGKEDRLSVVAVA